MTTGNEQAVPRIEMPEGGKLVVAFAGAGGQITIGNATYQVVNGELALPVIDQPANDQPTQGLELRVLEVGQRLRDGTVVLSVDLDKNEALFVPANIYGGKAKFDKQDDVVESVNQDALHGHSDWRRITNDEGKTLADNWAIVTTQDPEWFWLASSYEGYLYGRVRQGGIHFWFYHSQNLSNPVPVVRSGPARVPACELA